MLRLVQHIHNIQKYCVMAHTPLITWRVGFPHNKLPKPQNAKK